MALLHTLRLKNGWSIVVDPVLLTILSTPLLYWLLVRPIWYSLRQRTRAMEALRTEKSKAQMYLDIAGVILVVLDSEGRVTLINRKGIEILGYEEHEILGRNWFDNFVPDVQRNQDGAWFEELMTGEKASVEHFENLVLAKNHDQRIIAWHLTVLRDAGGNAVGTLSSGEDVTERKRMEEDLRKYRERLEERVLARTTELTQTNKQLREEIERRKGLERELLSVVEQERQRIGQELHDSIGQQLTGIAFMMEVLGEKLADKSLTEEAPYAEKINARVSRAVDLARDLAKGLHPIDLDRNGLAAVLQELAADTEQLFDVSCTFSSDEAVSMSRISAPINLYRIAQEAITNAVKHGKARNISVRLSSENGSVVLSVENDGLDFPAEPGRVEGMGLKIMRYRAELMNSSL
ncbi:MAG: PAS domain S-box protein, partial [Planctomycetota bacterium]